MCIPFSDCHSDLICVSNKFNSQKVSLMVVSQTGQISYHDSLFTNAAKVSASIDIGINECCEKVLEVEVSTGFRNLSYYKVSFSCFY